MKYWLVSDSDIQIIRTALEVGLENQHDSCAESGCMCDLYNDRHSDFWKDALHTLDSGLHTTNTLPADIQQALAEEKHEHEAVDCGRT